MQTECSNFFCNRPFLLTRPSGIEVCDHKCYDVTVKDLEKCSEITDIIIRVSCLVHMRRPFFKLKDCSQDAIDICKAYNIDPYKYLCDVFRRIKNTAKDQLVNLVAHKWQPQMTPAIY